MLDLPRVAELRSAVAATLAALSAHGDTCPACRTLNAPRAPLEMHPPGIARRLRGARIRATYLTRCADGLALWRAWRVALDRLDALERLRSRWTSWEPRNGGLRVYPTRPTRRGRRRDVSARPAWTDDLLAIPARPLWVRTRGREAR